MSKLIPIEDHIIVQAIDEEAKTPSWIVLPDSAKDKPSCGKVIAVWPGKILENWARGDMEVQEWDKVYFTKYSPDELEITQDWKKQKYLVIRHTSILAVEK